MAFNSPFGALPALQALQALHLLGGQQGAGLDSAPSPYAPQAALLQLLSGAQQGSGGPATAGLFQMSSAPHHHQAATSSGGSDVMHEPGDRRPSSDDGEPAATRRRTMQPALSDPQDQDLDMPSKHGSRGAGASKQEKNRQAQRRFRERQKNMIEDLKHWVDTLSKQVADKDRMIAALRDENVALQHKLGVVCGQGGEHAAPRAMRQEQTEAQVQAEASALLMLAQGTPQAGMRPRA